MNKLTYIVMASRSLSTLMELNGSKFLQIMMGAAYSFLLYLDSRRLVFQRHALWKIN